jgi:hypothetical protein
MGRDGVVAMHEYSDVSCNGEVILSGQPDLGDIN